ncbi:hypothetical protein [Corallococcus exercitus]|uniref:hypothetical protein n=1 Tax=Corallococcus exercitus TaxID=2316736 RepID=UPI0035D5183A
MPHHSSRGPSGLVPSWLRSLTLSSFALGGLLAAPAQAAGKEEPPAVATLLEVTLEDGELTARIQWTDQEEDLPESTKLVSYDGKNSPNAGVEVTPKAGEISLVKVFGALDKPWETGWAQRLVLEDAKGQVLATQPYDVGLDCEDDKECGLTVSPGIQADGDAAHVSGELDDVLTKLEEQFGKGEYDLVEEVSKQAPHLRDEVTVYAHRLFPVRPLFGPCTCSWQPSRTRSPSVTQPISFAYPGRSLYGWNGVGAKHTLSATALNTVFPATLNQTVSGSSRLTLRLSCSRWVYISWWDLVIHRPGGPVIVPFPRPFTLPCASPCQARFDHMARVTGRTTISGVATAREQGTWSVNGGSSIVNQLITQNNQFDADGVYTTYSNTSGYNTVSTTGRVTVSAFSSMASAITTNGYAQAIHGGLSCPSIPALPGLTITDLGTTQGTTHLNSLNSSLQDFAANFP